MKTALNHTNKPPFLDFFAGSGLVSEAFHNYFEAVWANDICEKKARVFCANHQNNIFHQGSIEDVKGSDLPSAVVSWGSFPCQDLSLAGNMEGISNTRSGLVWHWLRVMDEMKAKPPIVVAENVVGLLSAAKGAYYQKLHNALVERGYKVGTVVIDASYWVPQSRKRVFIIAIDSSVDTKELEVKSPIWCHPTSVTRAAQGLSNWIWWSIPLPKINRNKLDDIVDYKAPCDNEQKTEKLLKLVPEHHWKRLKEETSKGAKVFPGYKRMRNKHQVLELRFDGIAGCLRTPEGGSSRQHLVIYENDNYKTRLLTVKETAALMGLRDTYKIPGTYNAGYKAMGDAVAVPVARYLAQHLLLPLATKITNGNTNDT